MFLAEQILALVKTARYDRRGRTFTAELVGGYELTLRRVPAGRPSELPPPNPSEFPPPARSVIDTTGAEVIPFPARRVA